MLLKFFHVSGSFGVASEAFGSSKTLTKTIKNAADWVGLVGSPRRRSGDEPCWASYCGRQVGRGGMTLVGEERDGPWIVFRCFYSLV